MKRTSVPAKYSQIDENAELAVIEVNFGSPFDFRQLGVVNKTDLREAETNTTSIDTLSIDKPVPKLVLTLVTLILSYLIIHSIMILIWSLIDTGRTNPGKIHTRQDIGGNNRCKVHARKAKQEFLFT